MTTSPRVGSYATTPRPSAERPRVHPPAPTPTTTLLQTTNHQAATAPTDSNAAARPTAAEQAIAPHPNSAQVLAAVNASPRLFRRDSWSSACQTQRLVLILSRWTLVILLPELKPAACFRYYRSWPVSEYLPTSVRVARGLFMSHRNIVLGR